MKHEADSLTGPTGYLGHFAKREFLVKGHNTSGKPSIVSRAIEAVAGALGARGAKKIKEAEAIEFVPKPEKVDKTRRRVRLDKLIEESE